VPDVELAGVGGHRFPRLVERVRLGGHLLEGEEVVAGVVARPEVVAHVVGAAHTGERQAGEQPEQRDPPPPGAPLPRPATDPSSGAELTLTTPQITRRSPRAQEAEVGRRWTISSRVST